jgi:hypothetical protein
LLYKIKQFKKSIMTTKTKNIINWVLAGLVAFVFLGSAMGKFTADAKALEEFAKTRLTASKLTTLGIIEIVSVVLWLLPRTAVLGALLLLAYMGGAIATHFLYNLPLMGPVMISAFVWIASAVRLPEFTNRILGKN